MLWLEMFSIEEVTYLSNKAMGWFVTKSEHHQSGHGLVHALW